MKQFLVGRLKSIKYALRGAFLLIRTEDAIITQSFVALILTILGFYFGISRSEWMLQLLAFGLVLSIESLNTAVEKLCDFINPEYHDRIGFIKDISAGAVTFAALFAFAIICIIYWPYLAQAVA
ncbi:diacylglycerol kinase family protein [Marinilongibacter aquaticus]|uniref:diacylglycerol kinase family protein n=1 Tax=Marinilongibacter aquaticus TaxID=2975157 RepID=UPI0021BD3C48|nr:diacylglycerol kinase family protein [Marinilongibacter aquaticus]UBM57233.1 diacylglycerol kinase family protein [Marinilongibacter aquaticus]